ncbi:FAD/NAD(P)-binding domain-containing protein [Artomyces pyxidatus]|uniref:FAD/NAD(P)-binding domain-containing protein n=1 Tax=Artomyces pyxidatus TaxID=48021 RepID=A0ACB8TCF7_9AGAM|nr:FAD/NAD(P)-binding domain-containing protein [Artomyces pyxidatus]
MTNNSVLGSAFFISLNIVIVGCGLGGLTAAYKLGMAGHTVTVLERATALGEVGAGIQITPNVSRLLHRWGVLNRVGNVGIRPLGLTFLRYQNGERVGYTPLGDHMDRNHGAPYYHIHRADLLDILYDLARPYATIRLDARVVSVDPSAPTLTLHSGEVITADLIIGADGLNSMIREVVMGGPFPAVPTGDAAYRAVIPVAELENDPELKTLVETPQMTAWIGPGRHIVMYKIRPKHVNLVMCHPDRGAIESWTAQGDIDTMRHEFREFEPRVQKILSLVPLALEWRLMDRDPIPHWIHPDGKVALLGDACHPMLPYRAQGAAMAIEDAAVLGVLFSRVSDPAQIGCLLSAYETIRIRRATNTHMASRLNQKTFHYEDGPEQQARDASMREAMLRDSAADHVGNANQWADVQKSIEQFSYDAELAAENWWKENGKAVLDPVDSSALPDQ